MNGSPFFAEALRPSRVQPFAAPSTWRSSQSAPPGNDLQPQRLQHDHWTGRVFYAMDFELGLDRRIAGRGALCGDGQGQIGQCDIPPLACHGDVAGDPCFFIWFIERGELHVGQPDGKPLRFAEGALLLRDAAQPMHGRWSAARLNFVRLSRQHVIGLLGHDPGMAGRGVLPLDRCGLAPFLGSQLRLLHGHGPSLAPSELKEALAMAFHSAESLLRRVFPVRPEALEAAPTEDRLRAVHRYIEKNLHRHDLSVEQIAMGINSSRAQLYRLFEAQPASVHGTVREARLLRSFEYLQRWESERLSIGAIAYACGFSDQSVFSKLFRQRFGMTPSAAREAAAVHAA